MAPSSRAAVPGPRSGVFETPGPGSPPPSPCLSHRSRSGGGWVRGHFAPLTMRGGRPPAPRCTPAWRPSRSAGFRRICPRPVGELFPGRTGITLGHGLVRRCGDELQGPSQPSATASAFRPASPGRWRSSSGRRPPLTGPSSRDSSTSSPRWWIRGVRLAPIDEDPALRAPIETRGRPAAAPGPPPHRRGCWLGEDRPGFVLQTSFRCGGAGRSGSPPPGAWASRGFPRERMPPWLPGADPGRPPPFSPAEVLHQAVEGTVTASNLWRRRGDSGVPRAPRPDPVVALVPGGRRSLREDASAPGKIPEEGEVIGAFPGRATPFHAWARRRCRTPVSRANPKAGTRP